MNENFEEYMVYFKSLSLKEKQKIIYDQLELLSSLTNKMCEEFNIKNNILLNKELLDLKKENYSEDDFAEAMIVLINSIQNSICDYSNGISDMLDNINNN